MGGRGSASNLGKHPYRTEFKTALVAGNIKFVRSTSGQNAKDPLETQTKGRIYATINAQDEINAINFYDEHGKRYKSINLLHSHADIKGPHVHLGYFHNSGGTRKLNEEEEKIVAFAKSTWYNRGDK
jgi:hypothetical protein